ncbi:Ataxin-2, C-terminal [Artemisia annua]|uniref:Ataxin-2, C-terminal n=1 Tax=Artemisia annua TaxID=35608 RepID=A0A2U1LK26_ARTAN|nr:Ataxin-2, C-terminal [Artemisia annua]
MAVVESVNVMVSENTTTNNNNNNDNNNSPRQHEQEVTSANGGTGNGGEEFKKEMRDLEEMLSKLNPLAEEFVPCKKVGVAPFGGYGYAAVNNFLINNNSVYPSANQIRRKGSFGHGKRRMNSRTSMAQRDDVIKRTVYVSDIDQQVTEEQLAALFVNCGQVVDCRVCGDPNSVLHFAFIEFTDEEGARNALSLGGTMLGYYPVRVLPSKTAIAPVNPTFLPQSEDEREMCARTIYCTNIDKKVTQADVKLFFETLCGEVYRLRLLGDYNHNTRIAFVEFVMVIFCELFILLYIMVIKMIRITICYIVFRSYHP